MAAREAKSILDRNVRSRLEHVSIDRGREDLARRLERLAAGGRRPEAMLDGLQQMYLRGEVDWRDLETVEGMLAGTEAAAPLPAAGAPRIASDSGSPLAPQLQAQLEQLFGRDLSTIRVHVGADAATLTSGMGAEAMAAGTDIFLADAAKAADPALLAHEVAHVVSGMPALAMKEVEDEAAAGADPLHAAGWIEDALVSAIQGAMNAEGEWTPEQIDAVRQLIEKLPEARRGPLYEALQAKSQYQNQRLNTSAVESESRGGTCNMTALSMALESIGIKNPDPTKTYTDALDAVRIAKKCGDPYTGANLVKIAKEVGATGDMIFSGDRKTDRKFWEGVRDDHLRKGHGLVLSIAGHYVRVQSVTAEGLVVDDPFGKSTLLAGSPEEKTKADGSTYTVNKYKFEEKDWSRWDEARLTKEKTALSDIEKKLATAQGQLNAMPGASETGPKPTAAQLKALNSKKKSIATLQSQIDKKKTSIAGSEKKKTDTLTAGNDRKYPWADVEAHTMRSLLWVGR